MGWPIGSFKNLLLKSRCKVYIHHKSFPWTKKTKLLSIPKKKKKKRVKVLTSFKSVDFCPDCFFPPSKVRRLLRFRSRQQSGWVHAQRLRADVGYWWEVSAAVLLAALCREAQQNGDLCWMKCNDAMTTPPSGRKYPNQVLNRRGSYVRLRASLTLCVRWRASISEFIDFKCLFCFFFFWYRRLKEQLKDNGVPLL